MKWLFAPVSAIPLVVFRIGFGTLMLLSTIRFWLKGWIEELYIKPKFYFAYYGFEWVKPLPAYGMYILFFLVGLSALLIASGFFYRIATVVFFSSFTYIELIDKTNYLNHYYLISLLSFLLVFLPAHCRLSIDAWLNPKVYRKQIPSIYLITIQLQLVITYFFAGVAKIHTDWLLEAMPLKIWLSVKTDLPIIGWFLQFPETAYIFSWAGMLFDLSIGFLLWWKKVRRVAYLFVLIFHILTAILFPPIGLFPYIMIVNTLIFFSEEDWQLLVKKMNKLLFFRSFSQTKNYQLIDTEQRLETTSLQPAHFSVQYKALKTILFLLYFAVQLFLPFRYLLYPNDLFWTEEGFRFSWRVMLIEKTGIAFFTVKDTTLGESIKINKQDYLTPLQEKMMSTQPDMILQFAHFLANTYQQKGLREPAVFVESYVSLNGQSSRLFINPNTNLAREKESFAPKYWILVKK
ncbi:MAG: HTTM domain-containing protein [Thermoflexibacter sp.]